MNRLPPQEILAQEIALLQSGGGSLGIYAYPEAAQQLFLPVSLNAKIPTNTVNSTHIHSLGKGPNSCLRTFIVILLKIIFEDKQNPQILQKIKCSIYCRTMDLTKVKNRPHQQLTNKNMKKLLVQFFQLMTYCKKGEKIQNRIIKYPIILDLLTLSFRLILLTKNVHNAMSYYAQLDPVETLTCLSQFLHLQCKIFFGLFFFSQSGYFISTHDEEQFIYGHIKQSDLKNQSRKNSIERWNEQLQQFNQWLLQDRQGSGASSPRRKPKRTPKISFGVSGDSSIFVNDDFYLNYEKEDNQYKETTIKARKNSRFLSNMVDSKQFRQFRQLDSFIQRMQKNNQLQGSSEIKQLKQNIYKNPIQERFIQQTESLGLQQHTGSHSNSHGAQDSMPQFGGYHRNRIDTAKFDDFSQDDLSNKKCSKCFQSKKAANALHIKIIQVNYIPKHIFQNKVYPVYIRKITSQTGSNKGMKRSHGDFSVQAQRRELSPKSCSQSISMRKSVSEVEGQTQALLLTLQLQKFNQRQSTNFRKCIEQIEKNQYQRKRKVSGTDQQYSRGKSNSLFQRRFLRQSQRQQHTEQQFNETILQTQQAESPKKLATQSTMWRPYMGKNQVRAKSKSLPKKQNDSFPNLASTVDIKSRQRPPPLEIARFSPKKETKTDFSKPLNSPRNIQNPIISQNQPRLVFNKTIGNENKFINKQGQKPNLNFVKQLNDKKQANFINPNIQKKQTFNFTPTSPRPNIGQNISFTVKRQPINSFAAGNQHLMNQYKAKEDDQTPSFDLILRSNTTGDQFLRGFVGQKEPDSRKNSDTNNSRNSNNSKTSSVTNLMHVKQVRKQFQTFVNSQASYSQMPNDRMFQSQKYAYPSPIVQITASNVKMFKPQGAQDPNSSYDFNKKKIEQVNRIQNIHFKTEKTQIIYANTSGNSQSRMQNKYMQNSQSVPGSYLQNSTYRPFAKPSFRSPEKRN